MPTQTRNPENDISATGTWSGTAGDRWQLVYDFPDDSVDFLLHGTTAGNILFGYDAFTIPSNAADITLRLRYYDQEGTNGLNNIAGRLRIGSLFRNATTHNPTTTTTLRTDTWATNPVTNAAWTPAEINGTDGTNPLNGFGFVSTDANPQIRIYSVEMEVEYTTPAGGKSFGIIIG
jgi:hypothetical protein